MRTACIALLLLLLPGLLLPGVLQLCLCSGEEMGCCSSEISSCCCETDADAPTGAVFSSHRECSACVALTVADSELRIPAPEHAAACLPALTSSTSLLLQSVNASLAHTLSRARVALPPGAPGAPLPLRI